MKKEFNYPSRDGVTQIHGIMWMPEGEVKAVLQICHGMVEYIDRYDEFARFLAEQGYCVVGHDHLGHGKSIQSEEYYGYFHETKGNQYVIGDIHRLRQMAMKKYPEVPYFMLGHSMGSYLLRQYLTMYGNGLAGAIIMGTGYMGPVILGAGKCVCRAIAAVKGWKYRSALINNIGFGGFNRKFEPCDSPNTWVTSDEAIRSKYENDPLCGFTFTVNGYYQMFTGMQVLTKRKNMEKVPKDLPVFFVSGEDDPVGNFGKSVRKICRKYIDSGMKDVSIKLYPGDRHEILNETDRQQVYEDLYRWMEKKRKESLLS
ncbi:alpha/beta fold hydrolase [Sporofaciens sp. SGI.106]|uniref:alpha/beta fold hydrolase n=1 Tax=Sporofaciens sp. SGI.106 TaxID=3420568 RepID=UPI003CFEB01C